MGIFGGGAVRWLVERSTKSEHGEGEAGPGALYSSGLIAAGGVFGLLAVGLRLLQLRGAEWPGALAFGPKLLRPLGPSNPFGVIVFLLLGASLFVFALKKTL